VLQPPGRATKDHHMNGSETVRRLRNHRTIRILILLKNRNLNSVFVKKRIIFLTCPPYSPAHTR
jgi:hypothetical protein